MKLHELPKSKNYKSKAKIIGRGIGSGKGGHTVGRGMNGQSSRSGGNQTPRRDFEGGQNPLSKRLPKHAKPAFRVEAPIEIELLSTTKTDFTGYFSLIEIADQSPVKPAPIMMTSRFL